MDYSPGPWRLSDKASDAIVCDTPQRPTSDEVKYYGGYLIAESVCPRNLHLISAAPDLLEAAEAVLACPHTDDVEWPRVLERLRAAVAKGRERVGRSEA